MLELLALISAITVLGNVMLADMDRKELIDVLSMQENASFTSFTPVALLYPIGDLHCYGDLQ